MSLLAVSLLRCAWAQNPVNLPDQVGPTMTRRSVHGGREVRLSDRSVLRLARIWGRDCRGRNRPGQRRSERMGRGLGSLRHPVRLGLRHQLGAAVHGIRAGKRPARRSALLPQRRKGLSRPHEERIAANRGDAHRFRQGNLRVGSHGQRFRRRGVRQFVAAAEHRHSRLRPHPRVHHSRRRPGVQLSSGIRSLRASPLPSASALRLRRTVPRGAIIALSALRTNYTIHPLVCAWLRRRRRNLRNMQAIAQALGVGCDYCHVAERGSNTPEPKKDIARAMMAMTRDINAKISAMIPPAEGTGQAAPKGAAPMEMVQCVTCHRGVPVPRPALRDPDSDAEDQGRRRGHRTIPRAAQHFYGHASLRLRREHAARRGSTDHLQPAQRFHRAASIESRILSAVGGLLRRDRFCVYPQVGRRFRHRESGEGSRNRAQQWDHSRPIGAVEILPASTPAAATITLGPE